MLPVGLIVTLAETNMENLTNIFKYLINFLVFLQQKAENVVQYTTDIIGIIGD